MTDTEQPKPNWKEAFQGKDVFVGGELVDKLLYEDVGTPVYSINPNEKKTRLLVDREVGSEDFTVRQKEEQDRKLLGVIVPAQDKNEFVYLGVAEGGFVFRTSDRRSGEFHKDTASSFSLAHKRFGDYMADSGISSLLNPDQKVILKEENDPARFTEVVIDAVQKERGRVKEVKAKRADVREGLMKKLFGGE